MGTNTSGHIVAVRICDCALLDAWILGGLYPGLGEGENDLDVHRCVERKNRYSNG